MELLEQWRTTAYSQEADAKELNALWQKYFELEKAVYEELLEDPKKEVKGTVKELAQKYNMELLQMVGFLDGINDSLVKPNPIETMKEDTEVSLKFDTEKLYKNMVGAKADWLYNLPQWDKIYDEAKRKELYLEEKKIQMTFVSL